MRPVLAYERSDPRAKRPSTKLAPWAAALAALAVYACTLGGTYIYDDAYVARQDARVLEPGRWGELWTKPYFVNAVDKLYRPLTSMSFAVENSMHGDRAWAFHLVNVVLHMAASAAVAAIGIRLGGAAVGWIAGLLFAVHPAHVEAVAGLVGRAESMCALATLGGILLFLRPGPLTAPRILGIWACCVAAILSKEQGILFPFLLLAAAPLRKAEREPSNIDKSRGWLWLVVVLTFTLAAYLRIRERVAPLWWDRGLLDWYVNPMVISEGWDRILMPLVILGRYMMLLLWPARLSIDYGGAIIGFQASAHDPYLYAGAAALLAWLAMTAISLRRRNFPILLCLLALAICYGIVGNALSLIGTIFNERLMYLPSAFFLLIVGLLLARIPTRVTAPLVAILVAAGGVRAFDYARRWNDKIGFYRYSVQVEPRSERAYALLWGEYKDTGDWRNALPLAEQARAMVPYRWEPYVMSLESYLAMGNFAAAEEAVRDGLAHNPSDMNARLILLDWKRRIDYRWAEARREQVQQDQRQRQQQLMRQRPPIR